MELNNSTLPLAEQPDFYYEVFRQLPGLTVVMDSESRFIRSNDYTAKLFGYRQESEMLGDNAKDIRCEAVECATEFMMQDSYVRQHQVSLTILEIHGYANNQRQVLLTNKVPFMYHQALVGSLCYCSLIQPTLLSQVLSYLQNTDQRYYQKQHKYERSYTINQVITPHKLTKREMDCIFYLLRGKTMKEIGKILNISWRTIESYLLRIKAKWGCETKGQLIDFAVTKGYLTYIPQEIFPVNMSQVLHEVAWQR